MSENQFKLIRKMVKRRDDFLEENPGMKPFQAEIEERMKSAGSIENRLVILQTMMSERVIKLQEVMVDLVQQLYKVKEQDHDKKNTK
jgi:hypothetical protein